MSNPFPTITRHMQAAACFALIATCGAAQEAVPAAETAEEAAPAAEHVWQDSSVAFFGVTFIDTSTEGDINGVRPDETARTLLIAEQVTAALEEQGLQLLDLTPVQDELARTRNPAKCNGCDIRMGQRLGADYVVVSEVQKVSNLILSMNLYVREAETGRQVRGLAVDIRGNNDESWQRGMRYILTRAIFPE